MFIQTLLLARADRKPFTGAELPSTSTTFSPLGMSPAFNTRVLAIAFQVSSFTDRSRPTSRPRPILE